MSCTTYTLRVLLKNRLWSLLLTSGSVLIVVHTNISNMFRNHFSGFQPIRFHAVSLLYHLNFFIHSNSILRQYDNLPSTVLFSLTVCISLHDPQTLNMLETCEHLSAQYICISCTMKRRTL